MSLGLGGDGEQSQVVPQRTQVELDFWKIVWAVFMGMWLFSLSASMLYLFLRIIGVALS